MKINLGLLFLLMTGSLAVSASVEIPAQLNKLLKNKKEHTYIGKTLDNSNCEMKVYQNKNGFYIDAYERDNDGNIDINNNFGRFTLNYEYELYDFWNYSYGFEAVSFHYSTLGSSYDRKSILLIEDWINDTKEVSIKFKRHNSFYFYTFYHFECVMDLN